MNLIKIILWVCCFLFPLPLFAQSIDLSHGGQIIITASGGFNWDKDRQKITAYERAKAIRNDVTLTADKIMAWYRKKEQKNSTALSPFYQSEPIKEDKKDTNEIYFLEALGHVHIYTKTDQAWCDKAVYDMDQSILVMTGGLLRMTSEHDTMTALDSIEYYSKEHMGVGRGDAIITTDDHKQIRADVLVGYSNKSPDSEAAKQKAALGGNISKPKKNPDGTNQDNDDDDKEQLEKAYAYGHVWVRTQQEVVTGDRGIYIPDNKTARIIGRVFITRGANQVEGSAAIVNMQDGYANLTEAPGHRVSGLIVPDNSDSGDEK